MKLIPVAPIIAAVLALVSCAERTALQHVVLIKLSDPSQTDELIADMDAVIPKITTVDGYWRGPRFESNRPEVKSDFDVGLVLEFRDGTDYDAYVNSPLHVDLVKRWKPKCTSLTIYDIATHAD